MEPEAKLEASADNLPSPSSPVHNTKILLPSAQYKDRRLMSLLLKSPVILAALIEPQPSPRDHLQFLMNSRLVWSPTPCPLIDSWFSRGKLVFQPEHPHTTRYMYLELHCPSCMEEFTESFEISGRRREIKGRPAPGESGVAIARDSASGAHGCTAHAGDRTLEGGGRTPYPYPVTSRRFRDNFCPAQKQSLKLLPTEKKPFKSHLKSMSVDDSTLHQ